jgi:hypothetical protein
LFSLGRHGKGTYIWESGRRYKGEFFHDKRYGEKITKAGIGFALLGTNHYIFLLDMDKASYCLVTVPSTLVHLWKGHEKVTVVVSSPRAGTTKESGRTTCLMAPVNVSGPMADTIVGSFEPIRPMAKV